MKFNSDKQISIKILIMYMISALLFLSSIELHIHNQEAAAYNSHGSAVSITSLSNDIIDIASEIEVSPDGMLKVQNSSPDLLVFLLLLTLIIAVFSHVTVTQARHLLTTPEPPFYGTPSLRAPPQ
ncbi:MAG: hypothetical protein DIZ80_04930 [endosymbiont of Galathealinum brachiosum]|uniref:Uncharacterized protein n=1 Tax=endosymbiont of Galathealinum brachiosum TaxID=2200906 RepID=A0A370DIU9_9GAMM|nr:MAG: hypothetical protein DIZ80_04930 [endosymbiont of Galathealinum brachiosum]